MGVAYGCLDNYQQAILDFNRTIELNPEYAEAYYYRGNAYNRIGEYQQAIKDFKVAARLGNKKAQDFLRKQGINQYHNGR